MRRMFIGGGIAVVALCCSLLAFGEETSGTVQELGFLKFKVLNKDGTSLLVHLAKDSTGYEPADWRPIVGDEINVSYLEVQRRNEKILQATKVTLVKASPNAVSITSPVEVEIVETGRSGYRAKIVSSGNVVRFSKGRGTSVSPAGWTPAPGDKVVITFTSKPSVGGSGMSYVAEKVEKGGNAEKTEKAN
jgi:hypothetical protein